mmetsp:Transcript_14445/g.19944  ORF Transcript_14445/g.19944 Transcript_14445/m.19944 type:complete len:198 (-) Transcript_14445:127-720(-)
MDLKAKETYEPEIVVNIQPARRERVKAQLLTAAKVKWQEQVFDRGMFAPNSPSPLSLIHHTLLVLKLDSASVLLDIGCGEARWLLEACAGYGCRGIGVDVDGELLETARIRAQERGLSHLMQLQQADIKHVEDFSEVSVVVFYGSREGCRGMAGFLSQKILRPGARLVSVQFTFPWEIQQTVSQDGFSAYIYQIPCR